MKCGKSSLSYAEEDRAVAGRLTGLLESVGWSIWWDRRIPAGKTWRAVIEEAIQNTRCVVALWSKHSIASQWVHEEAEHGQSQSKLVPVLIERVRPPLGFRGIQAADLTDWEGSIDAPGFRQLIGDLEALLGKPDQSGEKAAGSLDGALGANANQSPGGNLETRLGARIGHDRGRAEAAAGRSLQSLASWLALAIGALAAAAILIFLIVRNDTFEGAPPLRPSAVSTEPFRWSDQLPPPPATSGSERSTSAPERITKDDPGSAAPETTANTIAPIPPKSKRDDVSVSEGSGSRAGGSEDRRCGEILHRVQLGEPLSDQDREYLQKGCKR